MKTRHFLAVACLALVSLAARAQTDFGIWTSAEIEKRLSPQWSLNGEVELRTIENSGEINRMGLKIGGDYSIVRNLKIGAAYQFLRFHDLEYADYQPRHRFIAFLQGKTKWDNFAFALRERLQVTTKDESDRIKKSGKIDDYKINPEWEWRNRLKVSYDIRRSRFTPSVSVESFYQLNNPDGNRFDGIRSIAGVAYRLDSKNVFDFSVIYNHEINVEDPQHKLVVGINYTFSF